MLDTHKVWFLLGAVILMVSVSGCADPTISQPVGDNWNLNEKKALVGLWLHSSGQFLVINLGNDGELHGATLEFNSHSGDYDMFSVEITLTHLNDIDFAFLGGRDGYYFGRIELSADELRYRPADSKSFVELVRRHPTTGNIRRLRWSEETFTADLIGDPQVFWAAVSEKGIDTCFPLESEITMSRVNRSAQQTLEKNRMKDGDQPRTSDPSAQSEP